jgi:hypothetical protein
MATQMPGEVVPDPPPRKTFCTKPPDEEIHLMNNTLAFIALILLDLSCTDIGGVPKDHHFNILLRYGILARNEINSFNDTFTKDLILDGTVTTRLVLSRSDLDSIQSRLLSVDILSYPDTFAAHHGDIGGFVTPYPTFVLKITHDGRHKGVYWEDSMISADGRATKLRYVFDYIRTLVEAKPEYRQLPPVRGGYL